MEFSSGEPFESSSAESLEPSFTEPLYLYETLYAFTAEDKREFVSVLVLPGLSDSELLATATVLHKLHPHSSIDFYDEEDVKRIKRFWACVRHALPKPRDLTCPDGPDEWMIEHRIASLHSYSDANDPTHNVPGKWVLEDKSFRRIGELELEERP